MILESDHNILEPVWEGKLHPAWHMIGVMVMPIVRALGESEQDSRTPAYSSNISCRFYTCLQSESNKTVAISVTDNSIEPCRIQSHSTVRVCYKEYRSCSVNSWQHTQICFLTVCNQPFRHPSSESVEDKHLCSTMKLRSYLCFK